MADYGIKVMKTGSPVTDTDIRNIAFSSKYTMLKYHSDSTVTVTITAGNTSGSVDVTHSLGYVPAFIAYVQINNFETINRMLPFGVPGNPFVAFAYVNSSIVRCFVRMTVQAVDRPFTFRVIIFKDQIA